MAFWNMLEAFCLVLVLAPRTVINTATGLHA